MDSGAHLMLLIRHKRRNSIKNNTGTGHIKGQQTNITQTVPSDQIVHGRRESFLKPNSYRAVFVQLKMCPEVL